MLFSILKLAKKKIVVGVLVLLLFASPAIWGAPADAVFFAVFPDRYDLVAILVEKNLYRDTESYAGLSGRFPDALNATTIKARVDRYASDLQANLSSTRAVIIQTEKNADPESVAQVLERLYFDGDPQEPNRTAKLAGVVVVGDVPLPVVNKHGNRFISLFPYTDFENPAYLFNPQTGDFELNETVTQPKPEIWHGVIPLPDAQNADSLAAFFDKNYLYHHHLQGFDDFGKRIFFSDLFWEKKGISPLTFKHYQNFIDHLEDIAYFRYSKKLLASLFGDSQKDLQDQGLSPDDFASSLPDNTPPEVKADLERQAQQQKQDQARTKGAIIGAAKENNADNVPADAASAASVASDATDLPDIQSKPIIEKYLAEFKDLFTKYPAVVNDLIAGTGRYDPETGLDSPINLITAKDKFTRLYLRAVNDMVEAEVDKAVDELQQDIPLISEVELKMTGIKPKDESAAAEIQHQLLLATPTVFANHGPEDVENGLSPRILGTPMSALSNVNQCTLFRGSVGADNEKSNLVSANRFDHPRSVRQCEGLDGLTGHCSPSNLIDQTPDEKRATPPVSSTPFLEHAGCQTGSLDGLCFPDLATRSVFQYGGAQKVTETPPQDFDNYLSCYRWRDKKAYSDQLKGILDGVLKPLRDFACDEDSADQCNFLSFMQQQKTLSQLFFPQDRSPAVLPAPDHFPLISMEHIPVVGHFSITMGQILEAMGFAHADWATVSKQLLVKNSPTETKSVVLNGNQITSVDFQLTRKIVKSVSSVSRHKEPTNEAINQQWKAQATETLPIDDPRYLTFQDKAGGLKKVVYPNIFRAQTLEDFKAALGQKEDELTRIAQTAGHPQDFHGRLVSLFQSGPDAIQEKTMLKASQQKIDDAIAWRNMDLDNKHRYLFLTYLNADKNGFVGERANGYEMVYVNAAGAPNAFDVDFHIQTPEEEAPELPQKQAALQERAGGTGSEELPPETHGTCQQIPDPPGAGPYLIWDFGGGLPGCSPWFEAMKKWMGTLKAAATQYQSGESPDDFYAAMKTKQDADAEKLKQQKKKEDSEEYVAPENHTDTSLVKGVELSAAFPVLFKGGGSVTPVVIRIKDGAGKVLKDEAVRVTLTLTGDAAQFADPSMDEDPSAAGLQRTIINGEDAIPLVSAGKSGVTKVKVTVQDTGFSAELAVTVLDEAKLEISAERLGVVADGAQEIPFTVSVVDGKDRVVESVNGNVSVKISDPAYGRVDATVVLHHGIGHGIFVAGKTAGEVTLLAAGGPLQPASLQISLLPGPPAFITLSSDSPVLDFTSGSSVKISAKVMDAFGNPVTTDNRTTVKFELLEPKTSAQLDHETPIQVRNGYASATLSPGQKPGPIRIKVTSNSQLPADTLQLKSNYRITADDMAHNATDALTIALLGMPAGDVGDAHSLGSAFLSSGKVEAVTTLTAPSSAEKHLLDISPQGGVSIPDDSTITAAVHAGEPVNVEFLNTKAGEKVGELVFTPGADLALQDANGISAITTDPNLSLRKSDRWLSFLQGQTEKIRVTPQAGVQIFDHAYTLELKTGAVFALNVMHDGQPVGEISFVAHFTTNVSLSSTSPYAPGITVRPFPTLGAMHFASAHTGNSSSGPKGVALISDEEPMAKNAQPGFSYLSLEKSFQKLGVGAEEQNKFMLLFAGGSSLGEANIPYASDAGIILGDPTISLNNSRNGGYSHDVGKHLFTAPGGDVRQVMNFDYNNDGFDDILVVFGGGKVELLENQGEKGGFRDLGLIFDIASGIADIAKGDFNKDGQQDLVVAGSESCINGETCIDLYQNDHGIFTRRNLPVDQKEKPQSLQAADVNGDGNLDLVLVDVTGNVKIYYGTREGIESHGQLVGNMGLKIDPRNNLIQSVLARYDGLPNPDPNDQLAGGKYRQIQWTVPAPEKSNAAALRGSNATFHEDTPEKVAKANFIFPDLDDRLRTSQKFASDENGGVLETGDALTYTIILKNGSASALRGMALADLVPDAVQVDRSSISCTDCEPREQISISDTNVPSRPFLIQGFILPANGQRTIRYHGVYTTSAAKNQKILVTIGNSFSDDYPVKDRYLDFAVTAEGNSTGQLRYFYSTGLDDRGHVQFANVLSGQSSAENPDAPSGLKSIGKTISDLKAKADKESKKAKAKVNADSLANNEHFQFAQSAEEKRENDDADTDGIPDSLDDFISADGEVGQALTKVADKVAEDVAALKCSPGCIPLPINMSFLTPGQFNVLGFPGPVDMGLPVFAFPVPSIIPVWPPSPGWPASTLRIYLSPTLTGGTGTGICVGPWIVGGACWAFAVSPLKLIPKGVCDTIGGGIVAGLSKANAAISKVNEGLTVNLGSDGVSAGSGGADPRESSGFSNYQLGGYSPPAARALNIRIPGFPKVLTDWFNDQLNEVVDKFTDLPDIYVIYPDVKRFFGENVAQSVRTFKKSKFKSMDDVLTFINSIPLIDIEQKEVQFDIPVITKREIERVKADADQWVLDLRAEVDRIKGLWGCLKPVASGQFGNTIEKCKFLSARTEALITSLNNDIERLDEWAALPKKIVDYRNVEAFYAKQIADYLDVVAKYTGGYLKKQKAIVKLWEREIRNAVTTIKTWQALLQIMLDYQESCDQCTNQRFTLIELLLRLFVAIPNPPVIPFPKLPDFVFDFSKIQSGWRIIWPRVTFKPYPFVLPKLPRIHIPIELLLPQIALVLPDLPPIPAPPALPQLPALPPLSLPILPDLPPAPKLPGIPNAIRVLIDIIKKIIKIMCLIYQAVIPIPEFMLKSQIELMTARSLTPLLPIDFMVTVTLPEIKTTYVDKIAVTSFLNFQPETSGIYDAVKGSADKFNKVTTNFVDLLNRLAQDAFKNLENFTSPTLPENLQDGLDNFSQKKEIQLYKPKTPHVAHIDGVKKEIENVVPKLEQLKLEQENLIANLPKEFVIPVSSAPYRSVKVEDVGDGSTEFEKNILAAKQHLENYIAGLAGASAELSSSGDLEEYSRAIAQVKSPFGTSLKTQLFASTDTEISPAFSSGKTKVGEWDPDVSKVDDGETANAGRLLAQAPSAPNAPDPSSGSTSFPNSPVGLFVGNPATGKNERVLDYTVEANAPRKLLNLDADRDGDTDLVYTSGPDVFLKEYGAKKTAGDLFHFSDRYIEYYDLADLKPVFAAVKPVTNVGSGTHDATITFAGAGIADQPDFAGYSVFFKRTPTVRDMAVRSENNVLDVIPKTAQNSGSDAREIGAQKLKISVDRVAMVLSRANQVASVSGKIRSVISNSDITIVKKGEVIHPLENGTKIVLHAGQPDAATVTLGQFESISMSDALGAEMAISVEDGSVEIINQPSKNAALSPVALREGMMIFESEKIGVIDGAALQFGGGATRQISSNSFYSWQFTDRPEAPQVKILNLDPANYFARVYAFNSHGAFGTGSEKVLLNPQLCGDKTPPTVDVGNKNFQVPLLKTLALDAGNSHDDRGTIVKFTLDTDTTVDSNHDGDLANDADVNNGGNAKFLLGPFNELGTKTMRLTAFDESGNPGFTDITVEIIQPTIILDGNALKEGKISGHIDPRDANVPIAIGKKRDGVWNFVRTKSADSKGRYGTDSTGVFTVNDLDTRDRYIVKNETGSTVAEIHKKSGEVSMTDLHYHLEALPAVPPSLPTRAAIVDEKGVVLTYLFFVPDVNTDTVIDPAATEYSKSTLASFSGVHVKPETDLPVDYAFETLPGDHREIPGATVLKKNGVRIAIIDVNGDILFSDSQLGLKVKARAFDEPVVFELFYADRKLAEIFIAVHLPGTQKVKIIHGGGLVTPPRPKPTNATAGGPPFTDISPNDPLAGTLKNLSDKGIIQGYTNVRGELEFKKEKLISRAEFTKITLGMLCIEPRPEAKIAPPVFGDIPFRNPPDWFFDDTKEANLQGFIYGYLKEKNAATSMTPFKPGNNITRAEAAKIIIEALKKLGTIDLSKAKLNDEVWYRPYIEIAQDLKPYLLQPANVSGNFLLTPEEAKEPNTRISRGEFALMADRVLKIRDCFAADADHDGLPDSWEKKSVPTIADMNSNDDPDGDGLKNIEEFGYGTNPLDPDTDHGGIKDGVEVKERKTDPLDPRDDRPTKAREQIPHEENIFVVAPDCNSCPCLASVVEGSDLLPGDIIFAALMKEDGTIFVKSEDITY